MIRKGEAWGEPFDERYPDAVDVAGGDVELAAAVAAHPGVPIRFTPTRASDLARALGLRGTPAGSTVLTCDAIELPDGSPAVNAVVFGVPPDQQQRWHRRHRVEVEIDGRRLADERALCVIVANGQYLRGFDVVPRGHPGDGRLEVHVYALEARERAPMQHRLTAGRHLPHPHITETSGRRVTVRFAGAVPWEADGQPRGKIAEATLGLVPGAVQILV
jgi:putative lipid kinase YegS-like protein